jgi:sugar lactone lactonase YvrE
MRLLTGFGTLTLAALMLAGCNGGSKGGGGPVPTTGPTTGPTSSPGKSTVVYVANSTINTVTGYISQQTTPAIKISAGISSPVALAVDGSENLYVDNCQPCIPGTGSTSTITVYGQGSSTPSYTISAGLSKPVALAVGGNGTLYVANQQTSTVTAYAKGSSSVALTISSSVAAPDAIAVDSSGNIYVANGANFPGSVTVYSPSGTLLRTLPAGAVQSVAVDHAGRVYISNCNAGCGNGTNLDSIIVYAANGTNVAYNVTNDVSVPGPMAFDSKNDLFVGNGAQGSGNDVVEYAAGTGSAIEKIAAPGPSGMAVDKNNVLYVTNGFGPGGASYNQLTEWVNGSTLTVSSGITNPVAVAIANSP